MRDKQFVAVHRGGTLSKELHKKLANWARRCAEHVVHLYGGELDPMLIDALQIARDWVTDDTSTGSAIKASRAIHRVARSLASPISVSVARSIGQAVAAAHMADHSLGAAVYALQAVARAGESVQNEREWQLAQLEQLQPELREFMKD